MSNNMSLKLEWKHQLVTGTGLSPTSLSYSVPVKEILEQVSIMLRSTVGREVDLYLQAGQEGRTQFFLKNPEQSVSGPDGEFWSMSELLSEHHAYPVELPEEFANEVIGRLFGIDRYHVDFTRLTDEWKMIEISLLVKPKDRYFIVIHPSSDHYLYVYRHEADDLNARGTIHLRDDEPGVVDVWVHDALELTKADYELLRQKEKSDHNNRFDYTLQIISKYLKGQSYRHFVNINPKSPYYRSIYVASPLQKVTKNFIEAFDEVKGDLIKLHHVLNNHMKNDYCEITSEKYADLINLGLRFGIDHPSYIEMAEETIHESKPVFGQFNRMQLRNQLQFYPMLSKLSDGIEPETAMNGVIEYLISTSCSSNIDYIMGHLAKDEEAFSLARAQIKDWVKQNTNSNEYLLTKDQSDAIEKLKSAMEDLLAQGTQSDSFNFWLDEQKIFRTSMDEILQQLASL